MLKNAMQLINILYQIVKGALQNMKISRRKWTGNDDQWLKTVINNNKKEGKTMKEACYRASAILNRTPSACETRWYQLEKNKARIDSFTSSINKEKKSSTIEPQISYLFSKQFGVSPSELSKANKPLDFVLLKKLLDDQEVENRKKEIEKIEEEKMSMLKEELKGIIDALDLEATISNKKLLTIGKCIIDIWFKQQLGK